MIGRQGTEQVEIDPVGTLVGLCILVDGNLGAGNDLRHGFRKIPDLIIPFVRPHIEDQKRPTRVQRPRNAPADRPCHILDMDQGAPRCAVA